MKKMLFAVLGLTLSAAAFACNWDRQNCTNEILKDTPAQLEALKQNQEFMRTQGQNIQTKIAVTESRAKSSNSMRAYNSTYNDFAGWVYLNYQNYVKKPQQQAAKPVEDKWADQCVVGKNNNVFAYSDDTGVVRTSTKISGVAPYRVSRVNGGKLVGLTDAEDGKFIGYAKKAELEMQDLRNCNMF